ncbi:hypothetical protein N8T08_009161 [Aspergillus melleus]|uniref:Uncharacterized protein n=1 Tax=Aspergillus melleus TaxID=138277 RepID=A0ACC3AUR1_9EURO|nr:hypothetical protein N8T08_009161 [Aspergillus melleus]
MPKVHTTPALHLLQWPLIRDLVAGPYDPHTLLQLEMAREPLRTASPMEFDLSNADLYIQAFFERVNVCDLLAELDLPHSGIVHFEELVDLPGRFEEEDEDEDEDEEEEEEEGIDSERREGEAVNRFMGRDELWYFLAEIALRRLLNRSRS